MRPSKQDTYLTIAGVISRRATCKRRKVGCVITDEEGHILSTGYNGPAAGLPHCTEAPCAGADCQSGDKLEMCEAIHAEQNAIIQCVDLRRAYFCYVTCSPCLHCIKILMNTPIKRIIFSDIYEAHFPRVKALWESRKDRIIERGCPIDGI